MAYGNYGKKWLTPKNIIIFAVVGVIVYAIVYFLFFSGGY